MFDLHCISHFCFGWMSPEAQKGQTRFWSLKRQLPRNVGANSAKRSAKLAAHASTVDSMGSTLSLMFGSASAIISLR